MDRDDHVVQRQAENLSDACVEDFHDGLYLKIMVARPQRSHLPPLPFLGALGNARGLGARHPASLLDSLEVTHLAPAQCDRPMGATGQHGVHLDEIESGRALAADAGWDLVE